MQSEPTTLVDGSLNVEAFVGNRRIGWPQIRILLFIAIVMAVEGFDIFLLANVAPAITRDFAVGPQALAPVLLMQQCGLIAGAVLLAPLADWAGRKSIIIVSLLGYSAMTFASTLCHAVDTLAATRFLTCVMLAGVLPTAVALATEYAPRGARATFVTLIFVGFSLGTLCGALFGSQLAATRGWRYAFYLGAAMPLAIAAVSAVALPESVAFLVSRDPTDRRIPDALRRLGPSALIDTATSYFVPVAHRGRASVLSLFRDGYATTTMVLWMAMSLALVNVGLVGYWMPTVLVQKVGLSLQEAGQFSAIMSFASIVSMLFYGSLIDRFGAKPVLVASYVGGGLALIAVALVQWHSWQRIGITVLLGGTTQAAQSGLNALIAASYPVGIRSTGTSWAAACGRVAGLVAPLIGGALMAPDIGFPGVVMVFAAPVLLIAPLILFLPPSVAIGQTPRAGR